MLVLYKTLLLLCSSAIFSKNFLASLIRCRASSASQNCDCRQPRAYFKLNNPPFTISQVFNFKAVSIKFKYSFSPIRWPKSIQQRDVAKSKLISDSRRSLPVVDINVSSKARFVPRSLRIQQIFFVIVMLCHYIRDQGSTRGLVGQKDNDFRRSRSMILCMPFRARTFTPAIFRDGYLARVIMSWKNIGLIFGGCDAAPPSFRTF